MPYYHVRLLLKSSYSYSYEPNLSEDDVKKLGEQYSKARKLLFLGEWVKPSDIREILIRRTSSHSKEYGDIFIRGVRVIFESGKGDNVTRQFITSPPTEKGKKLEAMRSKNVFVVHGRDKTPAYELARLLEREFRLETTLLQEQPHRGRTLIEKLEAYSDVGYAFVIVTPDDVGALKGEPLKERPRQNVVLEWGHFIAKLGRKRTCILLKGNIELPSDMHGVGYHRFHESVEDVFLKIKRELKSAGIIN